MKFAEDHSWLESLNSAWCLVVSMLDIQSRRKSSFCNHIVALTWMNGIRIWGFQVKRVAWRLSTTPASSATLVQREVVWAEFQSISIWRFLSGYSSFPSPAKSTLSTLQYCQKASQNSYRTLFLCSRTKEHTGLIKRAKTVESLFLWCVYLVQGCFAMFFVPSTHL